MDRTCILRGLRIILSAVCLVICGLLIALWVRSYWWCDIFEKRTASKLVQVDSRTGRLTFWQFNPPKGLPPKDVLDGMGIGRFYWRCPDVNAPRRAYWHQASILEFGRIGGGTERVTFMPYWFPILISAACAAIPWLQWSKRFSLRTLLIGVTLVAVVLGIVIGVR